MTTAFQWATLPCLVALALAPIHARAQTAGETLFEVALDIDRDGKTDRAALVRDAASGTVDLAIYLNAGAGTLDLLRKPSFLKKDIASNIVFGLESKGKGSLIIAFGCGGCSNDYTTRLAIVHRGGDYLVSGLTHDWERRDSAGRCDINFLTGRGVVSRGLRGASKPIKGRFAPVKLADWSIDSRPKACAP